VNQPLARIKEASSLGFKKAVIPKNNLTALEKEEIPDVNLYGVQNIKEALINILKG
jgi:DNA repair protein RadA/Sms